MTTATLKPRQLFYVGTRSLFLTHPDSYIQLPAYCIWMSVASNPAEMQYAWYGCVCVCVSMNHNEYFIFGMPCPDKQMVPLLPVSCTPGPCSRISI